MARTASEFAKRMVEAEREKLRDKERAAKRLAEAVEGLRVAAQRLRDATGEYAALEPVSRARLSRLLDLTGTESRIAYDGKHALVRLPDTGGESEQETTTVEDVAEPRPAQPDAAPVPTPW